MGIRRAYVQQFLLPARASRRVLTLQGWMPWQQQVNSAHRAWADFGSAAQRACQKDTHTRPWTRCAHTARRRGPHLGSRPTKASQSHEAPKQPLLSQPKHPQQHTQQQQQQLVGCWEALGRAVCRIPCECSQALCTLQAAPVREGGASMKEEREADRLVGTSCCCCCCCGCWPGD